MKNLLKIALTLSLAIAATGCKTDLAPLAAANQDAIAKLEAANKAAIAATEAKAKAQAEAKDAKDAADAADAAATEAKAKVAELEKAAAEKAAADQQKVDEQLAAEAEAKDAKAAADKAAADLEALKVSDPKAYEAKKAELDKAASDKAALEKCMKTAEAKKVKAPCAPPSAPLTPEQKLDRAAHAARTANAKVGNLESDLDDLAEELRTDVANLRNDNVVIHGRLDKVEKVADKAAADAAEALRIQRSADDRAKAIATAAAKAKFDLAVK